jgi:hypothetical protein
MEDIEIEIIIWIPAFAGMTSHVWIPAEVYPDEIGTGMSNLVLFALPNWSLET